MLFFKEVTAYQIKKLQRIHNHAARVVLNASFEIPITDLLKQLHWLPVKASVMFKVLVVVFRVIYGTAPVYLREMCLPALGHYKLRSHNETKFYTIRRRTTLADRSLPSSVQNGGEIYLIISRIVSMKPLLDQGY